MEPFAAKATAPSRPRTRPVASAFRPGPRVHPRSYTLLPRDTGAPVVVRTGAGQLIVDCCMPSIPSETDICDDRWKRTLHRACPRPGLDDPPDRACRPDRYRHLHHRGVPDAAAFQGPGRAAGVRRSARCRSRAGGHRPRQCVVPLWGHAVRRSPGRARSLRGRCGAGPAARSRCRPRLDASRGLCGVCPADPERPCPGSRCRALTLEPAAGRAGAGGPGADARTPGHSWRLFLACCPACRGRGAPAPPSASRFPSRRAPWPGALNEN